jgi:histidinol-phosphate phosphatase family protein
MPAFLASPRKPIFLTLEYRRTFIVHKQSLQLSSVNREWTLFLDRDGVINKRIEGGYVTTPDQFEFLPGVTEAIARFSSKFGKIIVVSNQQGIGKGVMTEDDLTAIHRMMTGKVKEAGGRIDAIYFAPQRASHRSFLRKPAIGMALKAKKDFPGISFRTSIMAGDTISDMRFGRRAGMHTIFIADDPAQARNFPSLIDLRFPDLRSFASVL